MNKEIIDTGRFAGYPHPIQNLGETDFYKISMGQCILYNFPKTKIRFDFNGRYLMI